ncbi:putative oxidoreductase YmfI [Lysinibacillus alkalisoli]|uniref:Oxidoreductase YmfI n=1 Tax=Lysinibacillus alkalisoli TaxID=1911548 RepID=A0A917G560_9BACI|nr:SDR family oxidoreductase [Lysinibacillus alkalisoli]GGG22336.1 putative oxidoreductase YmfI [Lysinibacillus alkalisoli]
MKKFALVVGATGAIGEAICEALASAGWSLYIHYNTNQRKAQRLVSQFDQQYPHLECMIVHADFRQQDGAEQLAQQLFSVQAIVFASGQAHYALLEETQPKEMEALWRVHVQNPMHLTALTASKLRQHKSYIVFIGSIWGDIGAAGEVVYSAVKGAQHNFVRAYAQEAAPFTRVNAIAPGLVDTAMNGHLTALERDELKTTIPLEEFAQPQDIAAMTRMLLSGEADYITGQVLRINGGWHMA